MERFNTKLAMLALVAVALLGSPAVGEETEARDELDANLMLAAEYLDAIRDNEIAAPQLIEKTTTALIGLAGLRNDLFAQDEETAVWTEDYNAGIDELGDLEKGLAKAKPKISASDASKILGLVRRTAAALKSVGDRLVDAQELSEKIYPKLLTMAQELVGFLANVLYDAGYGSYLQASPSDEAFLPAPRLPTVSNLSKTASLLRNMSAILDGVGPKMRDARLARSKTYQRLASSNWQLVDLLKEIVGESDAP